LRFSTRKRVLATRRVIRFFRKLTGMPDSDDPDRLIDHPVEEAVRGDGKLAVRELRELRYRMTRVRMLPKLGDDRLSALLDAGRSGWALGAEVT
jgi:hypothetical protein